MKRLAQLLTTLVLAAVLAVPVMADVAPEPIPDSSNTTLYLILGVVVVAAVILYFVLKKRKK